jgi:hypothetical protein
MMNNPFLPPTQAFETPTSHNRGCSDLLEALIAGYLHLSANQLGRDALALMRFLDE